MTVTGTLARDGALFVLRDRATGRSYELVGENFPERVLGLTLRVVGAEEPTFGGVLAEQRVVLQVQRWQVV